ncbi:MAG: tryptophan-rich sensory protein [Oscillospiraceae bacterium]|nr:tryptophan-rich sensory protein [Oscillospiraceae bacterium]
MKKETKSLVFYIAMPLIVGALSALFTMGAMKDFALINKPPLSPPAWLFPVVWTILYVLMGIASYLVSKEKNSDLALLFYTVQLFFNFLWSIIFFNFQNYLFAFVWLVALWILILVTTVLFWRLNKTAGLLMIPYLLWVTFAGYLNFAIYLLN